MRHQNVINCDTDCQVNHTIHQPLLFNDDKDGEKSVGWLCPNCLGQVWTTKPVGLLRCGLLHMFETVKCSQCNEEWLGWQFADYCAAGEGITHAFTPKPPVTPHPKPE